MRRFLLASACATAAACAAPGARAADAVVCVNCTEEPSTWVQFAATMAEWATQLEGMASQYEQLMRTFRAANHLTDFADLASEFLGPEIMNPIADALSMVDSVNGMVETTEEAASYAEAFRHHSPSQTLDFAAQEMVRRARGTATLAAQVRRNLRAAESHLSAVRALQAKANSVRTEQEMRALQARIASEQAALQNLQGQASTLQSLAAQQQQVNENRVLEKQRQDSECMMASRASAASALGVASFGGGSGSVGCSSSGSGGGSSLVARNADGLVTLASYNAGATLGGGSRATDGSLTGFSGVLADSPHAQQVSDNAIALGVNPASVEAATTAESGGRNVCSGTGACGPMQVIKGTYAQTQREIAATNPEIAAQMTGRDDPVSNYAAGTQYLKDAATTLQAAGVSRPNGVDARGYYMLGPKYGATLATAPDNALMGSLVTDSNALAVNAIPQTQTVGQWRADTARKLGENAYAPILLSGTSRGT